MIGACTVGLIADHPPDRRRRAIDLAARPDLATSSLMVMSTA